MSKANPKIKSIRITAYETSDGTRHETHQSAVEHDLRLDLEAMIERASKGGSLLDLTDLNITEFTTFLFDNHEKIGKILRRVGQVRQLKIVKTPHLKLEKKAAGQS